MCNINITANFSLETMEMSHLKQWMLEDGEMAYSKCERRKTNSQEFYIS